MKRRSFQFILAVVVVVAGVGSFFSTRAQMPPSDNSELGEWLGLSSLQQQNLVQTNMDFTDRAQQFKSVCQDHRQELARLLADPNSSEEAIRDQVQQVLESNNALIRCVVSHLLEVREYLTEEQRQQLTGLCSGAMCGQSRGRWAEGKRGHGYGYGQGARRGMGRGRGRGARFGRHLAFTVEQETAVIQLDPNFVTESEMLTEQMAEQHQRLSQLLEDPQAERETVFGQLDRFIEARTQFEQRTIDHLIRIRHLLTQEQTQKLLGLCDPGQHRRRGWSN